MYTGLYVQRTGLRTVRIHIYLQLQSILNHIYDQRSDMYVFIGEPKFSSIGYKVGPRFRLSYKYLHIRSLMMSKTRLSILNRKHCVKRV